MTPALLPFALVASFVAAAPRSRAKPAAPRAWTAGDYARIRAVAGPVSIKPLGHRAFVAAEPAATLIPGDEIKTGPGGIAHLELEGGAVLLVAGGGDLELRGEAEAPVLDFKLGEWLLGLTRRLSRGRTIEVHTPQAVAAVRGTLFWGKTDPRETQLAGLEHEVAVSAQGRTVTLKAGQLVRVPSGRPPAEPVSYQVPAAMLDKFQVAGSLEGVEGLLKTGPARKSRR